MRATTDKRWQIESEIKVLKSLGLESYMVRRLRAIRLWMMAVWHIALITTVLHDMSKVVLSFGESKENGPS